MIDKRIKYQEIPQLVKPRKDGKRPGYRGDDAARSSEGTSGGRADPGGAGRGDTRGDPGTPDRTKVGPGSEYAKNVRAAEREQRIKDVENLIDRPTFGFNDAARINLFNPGNILGGILGLFNPALGLGFRAVNYLKDEIPETLGQFKDSATLEEFRDKVRGYGRTMPTISPNPMYGGIETLGVNKPSSVVDVDLVRSLIEQSRMEQ